MTEYVTKALSIMKAVDAVHNCLVSHLPDYLEQYECDEEGLALPSPDKYALALSPTAIEETLLNAHVADGYSRARLLSFMSYPRGHRTIR